MNVPGSPKLSGTPFTITINGKEKLEERLGQNQSGRASSTTFPARYHSRSIQRSSSHRKTLSTRR